MLCGVCKKLFFSLFLLMLQRMVFFSKRYQHYQIGMPSPGGKSSHHRLPLFPISVFLSQASLPLLQIILPQFALSFYQRVLHLPISFPISGLGKFGVKPILSQFSWRAFASIHQLMPSSTVILLKQFYLLALPLLRGTDLSSL